ncbi:MAG: MFS family permease [Gammaproteobacteria bacterium]|jgi:MFS family permease
MNEHSGSWKGVLFGLGIAAFAAYQQFKLPVVLPSMLERYGYERTLAGGFVSVYALAGLLLSVWLSRRIERSGTATPILIAMGLTISGSLLALLQPDCGAMVLAGRALEGMGFAALAICGPVLANANATQRDLPIVIGLTASWIPIGQLSAVALAPIALAIGDWRLLWWAGIVGAVLIIVATLRLQRDPHVVLHPSEHAQQIAAANAPASAVTATPKPATAMTARERNTLIIVACIFALWTGQYYAYMTWLPLYLVEAHGLAVQGALFGYVVPVVSLIAFNVVAGAMLRAGMQLGSLISIALVTQAAVWWLLPVTGSDWSGVLSLIAYGIGAGFVTTCLFASPSAVMGSGRSTAAAFGVLMTGRNMGVLVGPVLLAWLAGSSKAWHLGGYLFGVTTSIAVVLGLWLSYRLRYR